MTKRLKDKLAELKSWQWFLLLYLGGFLAIIMTSYTLKLIMSGLPN